MVEPEFLGWLLIIISIPISYYIWYQNYINYKKYYILKKIEMGTLIFFFLYILGAFYIWQSSNDTLYILLVLILIILTIVSTIIFVFPLLEFINIPLMIKKEKAYFLIPFIPSTTIGILLSNLYPSKLWVVSSALYISIIITGYFYIYYYIYSDIYFYRNLGVIILPLFLVIILLFFDVVLTTDMLYWLYSAFLQVNAVLLSVVVMFGIFFLSEKCELDIRKPLKGFSVLYIYNLILNVFALSFISKLSNNKLVFDISYSSLLKYQGNYSFILQINLFVFILVITIFISSLFYMNQLIFDLIENDENSKVCSTNNVVDKDDKKID